MTLTGSDTKANYETALQSVKFASTSDDPTSGQTTREVTYQVTDGNSDSLGAASSNAATSTITVTATADAPVLANSGSLSYTEGGTAAAVHSSITVADADDTNIGGATVSITDGFLS